MKKVIILFILVILLIGCSKTKEGLSADNNKVDYNKAKELLDNGALLIDVRTKGEYETLHAKGAINIPLDTLPSSASEYKDRVIVVYCRSGNRSNMASKILYENGFKEVYDLGPLSNFKGEKE